MKTALTTRWGLTATALLTTLGVVSPLAAQRPAPAPTKPTKVTLANGKVVDLLSPDEERALRGPSPREVYRRANDELAARARKRSDFVQANPEAKDTMSSPGYKPASLASFSWVSLGAVSPTKNQNPYGTCWAFSLAAVLESAWYLRHRETVDLSEQDLINCHCRKCGINEPMLADEKFLAGLSPESGNPYKGDGAETGGVCKASNCGTCQPTTTTPYRADLFVPVDEEHTDQGSKPRDPPPVEKMKAALLEHGPLHVKMHIPNGSTFGTFSGSGVFNESIPITYDDPATTQNEGNAGAHIVNIVGWDDAKQAWLMKNSWGTGWGDGGLAWIKWGSNKIGMGATWVRAAAPDYPITAVWKPSSADELQAHGWEYKDYRARQDALAPQGYRLHQLAIKVQDGKPLYHAVWRKDTAAQLELYDATYADYKKKYDELWKDGWRLHLLANYAIGGAIKYSAVWRKGPPGEIQLYEVSYDAYRKKYDELWKDGWRLHLLNNVSSGVLDSAPVKYVAVWRKDPQPEIQLYEASYADYRKKYDELWKDGWRLHLLTSFLKSGSTRYTAVWRKGTGAEVQVYGWDYDSFRTKDTELRAKGLRLHTIDPL